jgi:phosphatidylinositol alpha-1,6-mannosyltransferase
VDPTRPGPLAEAITSLLLDRVRAERMGRAGAEWVHQEWTWEKMAGRLSGLLERVVTTG